ncbi:alpha/beta hydrolase [Granulicella sp. S156]|uniref:alpha/beta hydrolase n=1 Tax=Granulicella sp. S156 TaxID=1747224 RepID=UPI00131DAB5F|nr:alpha/beta hydrolase [Granulicella sp. S156]
MTRRFTLQWLTGVLVGVASIAACAQHTDDHVVVKLWPKGVPGVQVDARPETVRISSEGDHVITHVAESSITLYLPSLQTATGAAVILAPGGGHSELWIDHEGFRVAEFLSGHGVAAFVLKYRLAREKGSSYTVEGTELEDMQRAIRVVRSRSSRWGIDPARIGVMGFSAGGELAELASTRYDTGRPGAEDPVERVSSKPDFQALLYPAIPQEPRLTTQTPKAFLACGAMDRVNISQGLAEFYLALARLHVSAELHIYAGMGHGFGIRDSNTKPVADWPELFLEWMRGQGLLK